MLGLGLDVPVRVGCVVWPSLVGERFAEVVVLENIASLGHFAFAVLVGLLGCVRGYLAAYALYQALTTAAKTALLGEPVSDWSWDLVGDVVEFLAGLGLVHGLGLDGALARGWVAGLLCSWRGLVGVYASLALAWLAALAHALS